MSDAAGLPDCADLVIANAGWDGLDKTEGWQEAAVRWRDKWHAYLDETTAALGVGEPVEGSGE